MKNCECQTVKQYETGVWSCMLCRRKFLPVDKIDVADEQFPIDVWGYDWAKGYVENTETDTTIADKLRADWGEQ